LVGLLIGALIHWVEHHIDDGPIEISISLMVPYAAYLAAEFIQDKKGIFSMKDVLSL